MHSISPRHGFTLVTLAIALVIIGLLVGALLIAQDMIRSSELRSIIAETEKFKTHVNSFKYKYGGLPGDLRNAKSYWPDDSQYVGFSTPNGSGNGKIDSANESFAIWVHLTLAGLLNDSYLGNSDAG